MYKQVPGGVTPSHGKMVLIEIGKDAGQLIAIVNPMVSRRAKIMDEARLR